jgi:hypothetical protein
MHRVQTGTSGQLDPGAGEDLQAPETTITVQANPGAGCRFVGWVTTPADICEGGNRSNPCRISMPDQETRIEALFRATIHDYGKPAMFLNGQWLLRFQMNTGTPQAVYNLKAQSGDRVVVGDWDGDGVKTPGIYRDGFWQLWNHFTPATTEYPPDVEQFFFGGLPGDVPLVGDWNGDGRDKPGIFRAGKWLLRNSLSSGDPDNEFTFGGSSGEVPVVGDWDGDGITTVGLFQAGTWLLRNSNESGRAELSFIFGQPGDIPIAADWDGSGSVRPGIVRRESWVMKQALDSDETFTFLFRTGGGQPFVWR